MLKNTLKDEQICYFLEIACSNKHKYTPSLILRNCKKFNFNFLSGTAGGRVSPSEKGG